MKIVTRSQRLYSASRPGNILCLSIDRLNTDVFGAGGASWIETPAFDKLASESIFFDSFFATSTNLDAVFRAFWRGEAPESFSVDEEPHDAASLFRFMKEKGYRTYILSDVESVALAPYVDSEDCDARCLLEGSQASEPVATLEETGFFKNFEELTRFLIELDDGADISARPPWFVWAHFSGWNETWDFPLALREEHREVLLDAQDQVDEAESDPESYAGVVPPYWRREEAKRGVTKDSFREYGDSGAAANPDAATRDDQEYARLSTLDKNDRRQSVLQAYCGGVSAFDKTLGGFLEILEERGLLKRTLFMLMGTRGTPLGAPSALGVPSGDASDGFYTEETRVPLLTRLPDMKCATMRLSALCEPRDVFATLRDWSEFAPTLADPAFWKVENVEISAVSGRWLGDIDERPDAAQAPEINARYENLTPDSPGKNLFPLLVDETGAVRDSVRIVARDMASSERALVVNDWFLKQKRLAPEEQEFDSERKDCLELFVLPDDRYCVNDVASRCEETAEKLASRLRLDVGASK